MVATGEIVGVIINLKLLQAAMIDFAGRLPPQHLSPEPPTQSSLSLPQTTTTTQMYPSSSTQSSLYTNLNVNFQVSDFTTSHSQSQTQLPDTQNTTDPNSPEVFKQNVHMIQQQLARVQELARSALSGM